MIGLAKFARGCADGGVEMERDDVELIADEIFDWNKLDRRIWFCGGGCVL